MRNIISKILSHLLRRLSRSIMIKDLTELFENNKEVSNTYKKGEELFIQKWSVLDKKVSPMAYRFYSNYIGEDANIVPPDVARQYIEPILNQGENVKFYNDKNSFGVFINPNDMPKTLFRSIGYKLYDGEYNAVTAEKFYDCFDGVEQVIVKPAKDLGGRGIAFFERKNGVLVDGNNNPLSMEYLENGYKTDFLIQECFVQSEYMSQFNPTSVNTIRVNTYRDINTGEIHMLGAALRIGAKGSKVDNATSGGVIVGIDDNGKLGNQTYDKYGRAYTVYNDIDFGNNEFVIPNFESVKNFAIKISKQLPHMRLFALDVVLDQTNTPKLIEVNSENFSVKFLQLTKQPVFGKFTDDVIKYCVENKRYLNTGLCRTIRK